MPATTLATALSEATAEVLPGLAELIAAELAPKVVDIDLKGAYPGEFLKELGAIGGLGSLTPVAQGGTARGLGHAIQVIEEASKECVSTGFLLWAQYALQWYVVNSSNQALAAEMLPKMASGEMLGGTAQSNSMKSCVGIEEARLQAKRVDGGYVVNGVLPWVSNIGPDHWFHMGAALPDSSGLVIGLVHGSTPGLTLTQNAHFIGMEGTRTFACQFRDVFLHDSRVVCHADEFDVFRDHTKSAFILLQMGMGLGLIDACVAMMRRSDRTHGHINRFLHVQADALEAELKAARAATYALAENIERDGSAAHVKETLQLRLAGSELSLKAANAAMLHLGAKGYLSNNAAQRRLREAYFIAIVTPAIKHLRKELHEFNSPCALSQARKGGRMIRFAVSLSIDEAAQKLIAAIAAYPMGLVAHANGQANCAMKGISVPADQVLEVFRPDYAVRVWAADKAAGIDIPLRIHLYEADRHTWVAYRPAMEIFKPYANPQLDVLGGELDVIFNQLLATLDPWKSF